MNVQKVQDTFYGEQLSIETGKLAKQADGAVIVQYGETIIMATVVASRSVREGQDFFPLTVDYRERVTAAGKFRGGYLKREARPTQKEVLVCRLTDRPIRPLFEDGFMNEVKVEIMVISADRVNDPDVLSIIGASAALSVSGLPFHGPVGGVRIGRVEGNFIVNPNSEEREISDIDMMVAGSKKGIVMVEGHSNFIGEDDLLEGLDVASKAIQEQIALQEKLLEAVTVKDVEVTTFPVDKDLVEKISSNLSGTDLRDALYTKDKAQRANAVGQVRNALLEKLSSEDSELNESKFKDSFKEVEKSLLRKIILEEGLRADGRGLSDVRDIWIETGLLPKTHGSAVFTRGETQALAVVTLGGSRDVQRQEDFGNDMDERFYLHYTFPGYSVGECKRSMGPSRREIGHGILAERALSAVVPSQEKFPYTIRVTSDILESNGSSSMASVCAGSLALMDAGVPVEESVSGIAMGLIKEGDQVAVLSDILGLEDALGDMDFKVAGSRSGITSFQMDIKIEGLTRDIMAQALKQSHAGRMHILDEMDQVKKQSNDLSENAPRIYQVQVPQDKIGTIIGPGGKMIRSMTEKYDANIDITDDGVVLIQATDAALADACVNEIKLLVSEIEKDTIYKGTVKNITHFGAFVECIPGKEGLLHISRISKRRLNKVEDVLSLGQEVEIKCIDIDDKGRVVLAMVDLIE